MEFARLIGSPARVAVSMALGSLLLTLTAVSALADGDMTVPVAAGDTLSSISLAYYGDLSHVKVIAAYNHLSNSDKIRAGQALHLPGPAASASHAVSHAPAASAPSTLSGVATWYGPGFEGKTTKCGQTYHQMGESAASNDYPCGTVLDVMNLKNGRTITVPVTDTGAFRHPDVVDLSRGAFSKLEAPRIGVIPVKVLLRALPSVLRSVKH